MNSKVNKRMVILGLAAVAAFVLTLGVAYGLKLQNDINKGEFPMGNPADIAPLEEDSITVLLCGVDESEALTDVIMVAKFDVKTQKVNVLHIPRDTFIGEPYRTGKINAVYGQPKNHEQGIADMTKIIKDYFDIDIDYYATITLEGLRNVVDAMGGIQIDLPMRIEYGPNQILEQGQQTLNGEQAEWFVRYRRGYVTGDIGRMNAQELFLKAVIQTVRDKGRMETIKIMMNHYKEVTTNIPMNKAVSIANEAFHVTDENMRVEIVPGTGKMNYSYAVYEVDKQGLAVILNEMFRSPENPITARELPFPIVTYVPPPTPVEPIEGEELEDFIEGEDNSDTDGSVVGEDEDRPIAKKEPKEDSTQDENTQDSSLSEGDTEEAPID